MSRAANETAASAHAVAAWQRACALDVDVRKPGNVSAVSPGHRMTAAQFRASAEAAAQAIFAPGASVGQRIEAAVDATWRAVDCNTNLGIVLLCAPLAAAFERCAWAVDVDVDVHAGAGAGAGAGAAAKGDVAADPSGRRAAAFRRSLVAVVAALDLDDARAAFRAIARANPGGLGSADQQDVRAAPSVDLRTAMQLAAPRDRIARQYADGFAALFDIGLPALRDAAPALRRWVIGEPVPARLADAVQRCSLALLGAFPDSHILRKHGAAAAQTVMRQAAQWRDAPTLATRGFVLWDESLKRARLNPGTTADLTVASLLLAGLLEPDGA